MLVVAIVLGIAGVFSGGDDDRRAATNGTPTTAASTEPQGFPLTEVKVDDSGSFQDTFAIRSQLQPLLPRTQAVYVTLAKKNGGPSGDPAGQSAADSRFSSREGRPRLHGHRQRGKRPEQRHPDSAPGRKGRPRLRRRRPRACGTPTSRSSR